MNDIKIIWQLDFKAVPSPYGPSPTIFITSWAQWSKCLKIWGMTFYGMINRSEMKTSNKLQMFLKCFSNSQIPLNLDTQMDLKRTSNGQKTMKLCNKAVVVNFKWIQTDLNGFQMDQKGNLRLLCLNNLHTKLIIFTFPSQKKWIFTNDSCHRKYWLNLFELMTMKKMDMKLVMWAV